jgi:murein DD-endopeptidase MepM/ murein hydrolase activator NlpD
MQKIYYFSKTKLQYVEVPNFNKKMAFLFAVSVMVCSFLLHTGYEYIYSIKNPSKDISTLKKENNVLKNKLSETLAMYTSLDMRIDSLSVMSTVLRTGVNLPQISEEERELGIGGGSFDNYTDFLISTDNLDFKKSLEFVDQVATKLKFEKANYEEISVKLLENKKLYECIPAVKPAKGPLTAHGFGMRIHPILNRLRMHEGVDIVANTGTPVIATGKGQVEYVGYRGGFGLTVEINHGFGYRTLYAHLSKALVKRGAKVSRGDLIAKTGNTGLSTGPHLHYEVEHKGVKQDPEKFIFDSFSLFK